jgi:hypothetical protein
MSPKRRPEHVNKRSDREVKRSPDHHRQVLDHTGAGWLEVTPRLWAAVGDGDGDVYSLG